MGLGRLGTAHDPAQGAGMGAKRSELIAALMTSIVEAGQGPAGGDRDSVGWRQERATARSPSA